MRVTLAVRNDTAFPKCCTAADLRALAKRVCLGESIREDVEISVLLCDDSAMKSLNALYAKKEEPTDVLSFPQEMCGPPDGPRSLGDIAISLETVSRRCNEDEAAMQEEVRLLFCHGLLHLLGHDHHTPATKRQMIERQALYLDCPPDAAWFRGH